MLISISVIRPGQLLAENSLGRGQVPRSHGGALCVLCPCCGLGGFDKGVLPYLPPPEVEFLGLNIVPTADSPFGHSPQGMSLPNEQIT